MENMKRIESNFSIRKSRQASVNLFAEDKVVPILSMSNQFGSSYDSEGTCMPGNPFLRKRKTLSMIQIISTDNKSEKDRYYSNLSQTQIGINDSQIDISDTSSALVLLDRS